MTDGVIDVIFQTIESVPVIELSNGLRCGIVAEVVASIFFGTEN